MAKGQLRSNKEARKPKKDKKPAAAPATLSAGKNAASASAKPKGK